MNLLTPHTGILNDFLHTINFRHPGLPTSGHILHPQIGAALCQTLCTPADLLLNIK
jgi:hypothetical protein